MKRQGRQEQIRLHLLELIQRSAVGALLPTEKMLKEQFQVSRMTIQTVMQRLMREGYVERRKGCGTFVQSQEKRIFNDAEGSTFRGNLLYVYPDFASLNYLLFRKLIEESANLRHLNVLELRLSRQSPLSAIRKLAEITSDLRGIIHFALPSTTRCPESYEDYPCPVIQIGGYSSTQPNFFSLNPDYEKLGHLAVEYLLRVGYRQLVFVANEPYCEVEVPLVAGMKQQLRDQHLPQRTLLIKGGALRAWDDSMAAAYTATRELLATQPLRDTAIIYRSYGGALAGLRCLTEAKLRVPEDVGILVTDSPWPGLDQYLAPRLSYITCLRERVIAAAFEVIDDASRCHSNNIRINVSLHEQESTTINQRT